MSHVPQTKGQKGIINLASLTLTGYITIIDAELKSHPVIGHFFCYFVNMLTDIRFHYDPILISNSKRA